MIERELKIAFDAAKSASKVLKDQIGKSTIISSIEKDIKISADIEAENIIIEEIKKNSKFHILSEEAGFLNHTNKKSNDYRWIIDPLDGSMNYHRGILINCVSISLWKDNIPILGVIYDFNADNLFSGIVNKGAWCNNIPINVSKIKNKSASVICTGFPVYTSYKSSDILDFVDDVKEYKKVRMLGSAAYSLSLVSSGSADVYKEKNIAIWDVAAGLAIVKAAGGFIKYKFTDKDKQLLNVAAAANLKLL